MPLIAIGLNHQTAPLSMREKVAVDAAALPDALAALRALDGVEEAALLSTCNRTEVYARLQPAGEAALLRWLAAQHALDEATLCRYR